MIDEFVSEYPLLALVVLATVCGAVVFAGLIIWARGQR